ncbi:MAG: GDP-mannose 4,6-dehydratase [Candidatus Aminicenantia bacterium]
MKKLLKTSSIGGESEFNLEMSAKVFITGLTGFAGNHLSQFLEKEGYEVYGTSWHQKIEGRRIFYLDLRNVRKLKGVLKSIEPKWIFHLAALSHVGESWEKTRQTFQVNFFSTLNVFECASLLPSSPRILFVSSAEVYGNVDKGNLPLKEEHPPNPINPYALSKFFGELLARFYNFSGLEIIIARPFNYTGPAQSPKFVCSDFAHQIAMIEKGKAEQKIKTGNLSMRRDFTDVRDVMRAFYILMKKGEKGGVYNICSGKSYSIEEILNTLLSFSKVKIKIVTEEKRMRKLENPEVYGDFSKIADLGWKPEIPIHKTLKDLLNWWREKL